MLKSLTKKIKSSTSSAVSSWTVMLFVTFIVIILSSHLSKLKTEYSFDQFLPIDHQFLKTSREVKKYFSMNGDSPILLTLSLDGTVRRGSWLNPVHLEALNDLSEEISQFDHVNKVLSLANAETAHVDGDELRIGPIKDLISSQGFSEKTSTNPLIQPNLLSANGRDTILLVSPQKVDSKKLGVLLGQIKGKVKQKFPSTEYQLGGAIPIRKEMKDLLHTELSRFLVLSFLASLLVLVLLFQGIWPALNSLICLVYANLAGLGVLALFGFEFTVLSSTVPIIISVIVVAITTHSFVRMSGYWKEKIYGSPQSLAVKALRELAVPHCLTILTTVVGFATLFFSDVPAIRDYGKSVAIGVTTAFIVTMVLFPTLHYWGRLPVQRKWMVSLFQYIPRILKYPRQVLLGFLAASVGLVVLGNWLSWDGKLFDDLPIENQSRAATEFISENMGGVVNLNIMMSANGQDDFWKESKNLLKLDQLTSNFRNYNGVGSVISLADYFKNASETNEIPQDKRVIAETLFLYGMSDNNPIKNHLRGQGQHTLIKVRLQDLPGDKMQKLVLDIENSTRAIFPGLTVRFSGPAKTFHPLSQEVSKTLMYGFFQAMLLILPLLIIIFRSIPWACVAIIPNLIPPLALIGALGISGVSIKPSIAIIFAISLGLAFDNTVYLLERLKKMCRVNKELDSNLLKKLIETEGQACFGSSLALFVGFAIFMLSQFSMTQVFGSLMLVSLFAGLCGDLILLPAFLSFYPRVLKSEDDSLTWLSGFISKGYAMIQKPIFLFPILLSLGFHATPADARKELSADKILHKVERMTQAKNESAKIKMKITESDGSKKERLIEMKRKMGSKNKSLVKLLEPADLKGVGLLSEVSATEENQWLYLPSSKRSRRIVGSNKKSKFLDSNLTYEDLMVTTYSQFTNKVIKIMKTKRGKIAIIESRSKSKSDSTYGKIQTYVQLDHWRIERSKYFDHKGKLVKQMDFSGYKKYGNKIWRAKKIIVQVPKSKARTVLELIDLSLEKIKEGKLSLSALEEG